MVHGIVLVTNQDVDDSLQELGICVKDEAMLSECELRLMLAGVAIYVGNHIPSS